jgi:hypothetical protein
MQTAEDEGQTSPMKSPKYLASVDDAEGKMKTPKRFSTGKKKLVVCDRADCNRTFRRPSELT